MKTAKITAAYMDHMGSDLTVVNAARASFGTESSWDLTPAGRQLKLADHSLISFLSLGLRSGEWDKLAELVATMTDIRDVKEAMLKFRRAAQHWAPFAHPHLQVRVKLPLFLARQFVKHCVAGDTQVTFVKWVKGGSNGTRRVAIKDLYAMWVGTANKYQSGAKGRLNVSGGHVRVYDSEAKRFASSHISDVIYQGTKPVFKVATDSGQVLRATGNHTVMTQRGWVPVSNLNLDDRLITEIGVGDLVSEPPAPRWKDWADKQARRVTPREACTQCGVSADLEADHIVSVSTGGGHDAENMQCLCRTCHKAKSAAEKAVEARNQYAPRYTKITSIEPDGEEDVYDITVEGTHNFMANGLVVHNCVGGVWSEESRRYMSSEPEFWLPDVWKARPEDIKQGASGLAADQVACFEVSRNTTMACLKAYNDMLALGVAPEEARTVLPLNTMTTVVWTGSLLFWSRVANQRLDGHAQTAAQQLAKQLAQIIEPYYPVSWKALVGNDGKDTETC
jgi:thymidylate synthase ThyX